MNKHWPNGITYRERIEIFESIQTSALTMMAAIWTIWPWGVIVGALVIPWVAWLLFSIPRLPIRPETLGPEYMDFDFR